MDPAGATHAHPAGPSSRRRFIVAVVVAAFLLRVGLALVAGSDVRQSFVYDATLYDHIARQILGGRGFVSFWGQPTAFLPPAYPAILSVAYFLFGPALLVAWILNATFAALTCVFVYLIGRRLFSPAVGCAGAAILAVCPGDGLRSTITMSEATFGCFFAAVIYMFVTFEEASERRGLIDWSVFGVVLGATALVRGVALPFVAVPAIIWLARHGARVALRRTCATLVGVAVAVLPWTVRNAVVVGYPALISTDAPHAFFNSHNPLAFGSESLEMHGVREREWPWIRDLPLEQQEAALARAEMSYGLRYVLEHPLRELALIPQRVFFLYSEDHYPLGPRSAQRPILHGAVVLGADVFFVVILALALAGIPRTLRPFDSRLVLPLALLYFTLMHGVLFFGSSRYHAPLAPVLALMAALGAQSIGDRFARVDPRRRERQGELQAASA